MGPRDLQLLLDQNTKLMQPKNLFSVFSVCLDELILFLLKCGLEKNNALKIYTFPFRMNIMIYSTRKNGNKKVFCHALILYI